ncbi:MAG: hypothetical protein PHW60_13565 [Kiritimatiellae bacterium]|nr:hypothetical protein [Kiritimatiellia bacterium]
MNGNKVITKCCICGREKTDQGWQYTFRANEPNSVYSHGFCSSCYDEEVMKAKMRLAMPAMAIVR